MNPLDVSAYQPVFYPHNLAVIGASDDIVKFGGRFLQTLLSFGFKGKIYPVNPKGGTIQGLKAYPSLAEIPGEIDFAIITLPFSQVADAVRTCVQKGIKGAEILAAGFRENGPEGEALENEIVSIAREGGLRLIGPNCFGVYSPAVGMTLMPGTDFSKTPGSVGIFSQSGGGCCDIAYSSRGRGIDFSLIVSYGNACDIDAAEMLRYFAADPRTKVVGAYIEGVRDGRAFLEALKSCATAKPVVVLKGGLSSQGKRGTVGHTGSLSGSRQAWEAAIKSAGAVKATDLNDLVECLMAFDCLADFTGENAGIMGGAGMRVVESLDMASEHDFTVPELDDDTAAKIQALLPPAGGRGGNPVDLANPGLLPATIFPIMDMLAERENIDFLMMYQMSFYILNTQRRMKMLLGDQAPQLDFHREIAAKAAEIRSTSGKPLVMIMVELVSDPEFSEMEHGRFKARSHYTCRGIPCFDTAARAFSVLRRVVDYYKNHEFLS